MVLIEARTAGRTAFWRNHTRADRAQAEVGGMIARVGQRLLEGVARTMMDRFYACLAKQVEQGSSSGQ
jgi:carbon monoxide dehydrogenase subunit G